MVNSEQPFSDCEKGCFHSWSWFLIKMALQPLGDQAVLASFEEEEAAAFLAAAVRRHPPEGLVDVVQAYATVAVFFTLDASCYRDLAGFLERLAEIDVECGAPVGC